ncbi:unnamed protein product (macronuclear) [Paramecium tetraurelia]|uniref:Uncharacterized protein n=1 Tax=Paramecium tetraurelia TaxID=5888 RepID=A0C9X5_PARTE|nr:uncharacterized protein GSPATT00006899001 [Paramecium tetraurelia]CAK67592.1 unnamed protein product [Paramecium tetraurelia]|eukprot:XP_001434989.1 hypothetical protein (macronuclear) [Paramecium tetraurelia strain d4-2]
MISFLILAIQAYGRNLQQGGNPLQKGEKWNQTNQALDQIFEHISTNLTQQQGDELELIEGYIFNEGFKYYTNATYDEKQKIFLALIGMVDELEKETEQDHLRLEKDVEYFSQLNITDKNIVLTKISQNLDQTLMDSKKEFNSKVVLQIINKEIENFQSNPDRSTKATWDIQEYKQIQEKNEQELEEIEYQIQEFLDQGLSMEKIREKITEFIDYFFSNSTLIDSNGNNLDEMINDVKQQEEQIQPTEQMKQYRQKVRELIRELLKEGKTEDEIQKEVDDYLSKNGVNDLSDEERNLIKLIIQKEILRNKRQQDYLNDEETKTAVVPQDYRNICYYFIGYISRFSDQKTFNEKNSKEIDWIRIQDNAQDVQQNE